MAAVHGLSQRPDVDASRLALAGWSHGGWAIMEALSAPCEMAGEMLLRDPAAADLSGVKAGVAAVIIDSFKPRGMSRLDGHLFVCSGAMLRGSQRAADDRHREDDFGPFVQFGLCFFRTRVRNPSVPEHPNPGEGHGHALLVGRRDDLLVADRAAGLDHRRGARRHGLQQAVGEGEESLRRAG